MRDYLRPNLKNVLLFVSIEVLFFIGIYTATSAVSPSPLSESVLSSLLLAPIFYTVSATVLKRI
ncbi:MAG: hypothetical protein HY362_00790 [Candidatus Aenigmarchaeota archaeon]|nr:hypothetical protein [Candidatus Aenigmarchaeota archaeon]